jgi:hypothetical protein
MAKHTLALRAHLPCVQVQGVQGGAGVETERGNSR